MVKVIITQYSKYVNIMLDGMRRIRTAIEADYWEISRKAQERAGLKPIIPSYMQ